MTKLARNPRAVLTLLAEAKGEVAGVDIANRFSDWSRAGAYAALAHLERLGLVAARWDVTAQRPRRVYRIASQGVAVPAEEIGMPQSLRVPSGFRRLKLDGGQQALYCIACVERAAEYGWGIIGTDDDLLIRAAAAHVPYCPARAPEMVKEELRHIGGGFARGSDGRS